jgi:hypothetical protein
VEAIVAPHSGAGNFTGREFKFTADGKEYKYEDLADTFTFEAGKVYNFTFTLMPQGLQTHTPDGLTNCYMIPPGGSVEIPISRAITYGGMSATADATLEVLWDDNSVVSIPTNGQLTGSGASRTFTVDATHSTKQGNAVVAIKVGSTIYWSWHIWVTDDPTANAWANNGYTFMGRNLGATSSCKGLYYQWGRKDPFPATMNPGEQQPGSGTFTAVNTSATFGTVANTIKNPNVFIIGDEGSKNDWYYGDDNEKLWDNNGFKTIYDPCPTGWRVPYALTEEESPWKGVDNTNFTYDAANRQWVGTSCVWECPGIRDRSGNLNAAGTGHCWGASTRSIDGHIKRHMLFCWSYGISNFWDTRGSYGFFVRCVLE